MKTRINIISKFLSEDKTKLECPISFIELEIVNVISSSLPQKIYNKKTQNSNSISMGYYKEIDF